MIAASTGAGTVERTVRRPGTGSTACLAMMACTVGPWNGGLPGEHLVEQAPERVDVAPRVEIALSRQPVPGSCSCGVPSANPVSVSFSLPTALIVRAIPKSATLA